MPTVTMSMEEYLELLEMKLQSEGVAALSRMKTQRIPTTDLMQVTTATPTKKKRKTSAYDRALKKALRQVNNQVRTKNGRLRKGITQAIVMRRAHKLARKMLK